MSQQITTWILSVGALVIGAVIGSALALFRTKAETKWRAKFDAYQQILLGFEDMRFWAEETYATNLSLPTVGGDQADLSQRYRQAKRDLWSYAHIGGLIISQEATADVRDLLIEIAGEEFEFADDAADEASYPYKLAEHAGRVRDAITAQLPELVRIARSDLGMSTTRWGRAPWAGEADDAGSS